MAVSWRKLKTEYVTGTDSYRVLAERYGISLSTLSKVAKKEGWAQARRQYGDKVDTKTVEAMCARASAREVARLEGLQRAAVRMSEELEKVLADPQQFYRHIVSESRHTTTKEKTESKSGATVKVFKKADVRAMKDYTSALATLTKAMRDLYSLPTDIEAHAMEMAAQRLLLDREKAALGEEDDKGTGVLIIEPVLEEAEENTMDAEGAAEDGNAAQTEPQT